MTKPNYTCQNCNTQFQPKSPKKNRVPKFCCRDCYFEFRFKKNPNKITTKEFVIRSRAVHGDKYDYSKTTYTKSRNKVVITCPVHGDFEQAPLEHYGGFGCKECANDAKRLDREMFVEHSQKKHNNYYSYDKVGEVRDKKDILTITCPKHGDFEQRAYNHLAGRGCTYCGLKRKSLKASKTTEEFVADAIKVHGDKYDYSKTVYTGTTNKVLIVCHEHGDFWQLASGHLRGHGCSECGKVIKSKRMMSSSEEFLKRCSEIHNDKYSYEKTVYKGLTHKMLITCPEHGDFWQLARSHVRGSGCRKCTIYCGIGQKGFLRRVIKATGGRYDLSRVKYVNQDTRVEVGCSEHGFVWTLPQRLERGMGCSFCAGTAPWNKEVFLSRIPKEHKLKYDYSKVKEITSSRDKVVITCPIHGDFEQTPKSHAQGSGCPDCGMEARGFGRSDFILACDRNGGGYGILYIIKCFNDSEEFYKVGITSTSIERRMSGDISMPYDYVVEYSHKERAEFVFDLETTIHRLLRNKTYQPEIFFAGHTECFESIKPIKRLIERLTNSKQLQLIA